MPLYPRFSDWPVPRASHLVTGRWAATHAPWSKDRPHLGIDLAPVSWMADRPIRHTGIHGAQVAKLYRPPSGFGNAVVLDHGETYRWRYSVYAHLSTVAVEPGDTVPPNAVLGQMGSTGVSSGVHLHWQLSTQEDFPREIRTTLDPLITILEKELTPQEVRTLFIRMLEDEEFSTAVRAVLVDEDLIPADDEPEPWPTWKRGYAAIATRMQRASDAFNLFKPF